MTLTTNEPIYWETRAHELEAQLEAATRELAEKDNALANAQRLNEGLSEQLAALEKVSTQPKG